MRKKICLLLALVAALFMFSNEVGATTMWMECDYGSSCEQNDNCESNYNSIYYFTEADGDGYFTIQSADDSATFRKFVTDCWLTDFSVIGSKCKGDAIELSTKAEIYDRLRSGVCPAGVRAEKGAELNSKERVPAGTSRPVDSTKIEEPIFVAYSYTSDHKKRKGQTIYVIEAYTEDGLYAFVNANEMPEDSGDVKEPWYIQHRSVHGYKQDELRANYGDFWKVTNFESQAIYAHKECEDYDDCVDNHDYKLIFDSNDSTGNFKQTVQEWYNKEKENFLQVQGNLKELLENDVFIKTLDAINSAVENPNSKVYEFPSNYSASMMINDLDGGVESLRKLLDVKFTDYATCNNGNKNENITALASATTYFWTDMFDICYPDPVKLLAHEDFQVNIENIRPMIDNKIAKYVDDIASNDSYIDILDIENFVDKYIKLFLIASSYLDKYSDQYQLSSEEKNRVDYLRGEYELFANERNFSVILDCEGLLGQDLINKINSYLDIIKIVVPILLLGLAILDFTKAVFAGADDMKKAQKNFGKRILIAVIIFLTPTLLNFLLNMANKVWPIIEPSTCGIEW